MRSRTIHLAGVLARRIVRGEQARRLNGFWVAAAAVLLLAGVGRADEPPVRNRPSNFSDAVGTFEISTEAKPTELRVGQALTFTVRITATGPVQAPPSRPNLRELTAFQQSFYIESLPGADDSAGADDKTAWEFAYRLKPRDEHVDAVPSLPFVYYKPAPPGSGGRGSFQTIYAPRLPLTVKPAGEPAPTQGPKDVPAVQAPESVFQIVEGPAVLRRPVDWDLAGPVAAGVVLIGMPAACVAWYLLWRRRYPDAARLARQRRGQAARHALRALDALRKQAADEQARQAAAVVALYLRERIQLRAAAPTPEEAAAHLRRAGVSAGTSDAVAGFFRSCDVARFAPDALRSGTPAADGWAAAAGSLILTLEAEPCLSQAS
jgi:hypothetical protein